MYVCVHVRALPKFNMRSLKKRKTKYTYKRERETEKRERTKRRGSIACPLFLCGWRKKRERKTLSSMQRGWHRERDSGEKNFPPRVYRELMSIPFLFSSLSFSPLFLLFLSHPSPLFSLNCRHSRGNFRFSLKW